MPLTLIRAILKLSLKQTKKEISMKIKMLPFALLIVFSHKSLALECPNFSGIFRTGAITRARIEQKDCALLYWYTDFATNHGGWAQAARMPMKLDGVVRNIQFPGEEGNIMAISSEIQGKTLVFKTYLKDDAKYSNIVETKVYYRMIGPVDLLIENRELTKIEKTTGRSYTSRNEDSRYWSLTDY